MRRFLDSSWLVMTALALLGSTPAAWGCAYGVESPLNRFVRADYVFVGKVTSVEEQTILARFSEREKHKQEFKIAVVEVKESLKDAAGMSEVRIGFYPSDDIRKGMEGCFFVTQHFEMAFTMPSGGYDAPTWRSESFDRFLKPYQRLAQLWKDPVAGLTADDADDRLLTAGLLLNHHRVVARLAAGEGPTKLEAIDAEHSRLILEVLTRADWSTRGPYRLTPARLFGMLDLTARDGWTPPAEGFKDSNELERAARKWLRARANAYRITTYVRS